MNDDNDLVDDNDLFQRKMGDIPAYRTPNLHCSADLLTDFFSFFSKSTGVGLGIPFI